MKRFILTTVVILAFLAQPLLAGIEPSPFQPEINQLYAIDNQLQSIGKRVDDKLGSPPMTSLPVLTWKGLWMPFSA